MLSTSFEPGVPVTSNARVRTVPVDLSMRFHLVNDSRWQPYLSAGGRYVNSPDVTVAYIGAPDPNGSIPVRVRRLDRRMSAETGAGLTVMLTRRFGLRGDVKRLLRGDDSPFDPLKRATFGLQWNL